MESIKIKMMNFSQQISLRKQMHLILLLTVTLSPVLVFAQNPVKLEKLWATQPVLQTPECVAIDYENDVLYVSNVNKDPWVLDGNGFISKLSLDGKVIKLQWAKGMHGPKGMGVYNGFLYVADIDAVYKINTKNGKVVQRIPADPTFQLNDISIAKDGTVYVSGSNCNKIFKIGKNELELFIEDVDNFDRPNGLLAEEDRMLALTSGSSILYEIDYANHEKRKLAGDLGHGDGIADVGDGRYLLTDWQGRIFFMDADNEVTTLLDTRKDEIYSADIAYYIEKNILLVPTFFDNRVVAYRLVK